MSRDTEAFAPYSRAQLPSSLKFLELLGRDPALQGKPVNHPKPHPQEDQLPKSQRNPARDPERKGTQGGVTNCRTPVMGCVSYHSPMDPSTHDGWIHPKTAQHKRGQ